MSAYMCRHKQREKEIDHAMVEAILPLDNLKLECLPQFYRRELPVTSSGGWTINIVSQ